MMKIAIAGTNGLAQFIAYYLSELTSHSFVFLTRTPNPGLEERNWQVLVAAYDNPDTLVYTLRGVDIVISTINGEPQLALLEAAATAQVRHFIPSGFSGPEQCTPRNSVRTDWQDLIGRLQFHETKSLMRSTIFTCGAFYENFAPGGLNAFQISTLNNHNACLGEEGDLLVDLRAGKATIPVIPGGEEVAVCMTSARDIARYVVATMRVYEDPRAWPQEFKFCTERFTMSDLLALCARVKGSLLIPQYTTPSALNHALTNAEQSLQPSPNSNRVLSISRTLAIAERHPAIDFPLTEINLTSDVLAFAQVHSSEPTSSEGFEEWLMQAWATPLAPAPTARASVNTSGKSSGVSSRGGSSQKSKRPTL